MARQRSMGLAALAIAVGCGGMVAVGAAGQGRGAATPSATQQAAAEYRTAMEQADLAIQQENHDHSEVMKNLEYLTTEIGPRLTGGHEMQAATAWTVQRFKDYGLDVHAEDATVEHAWYPGVDTAEILAPWHKVIDIHAEAYSKTTCPDGQPTTDAQGRQNPACEITAPVVVLTPGQAPTADEVKGKVVLQSPPTTNNLDPDYVADNSYDAVIVPPKGVPSASGRGGRGGGFARGGGAGGAGAANPLDQAALVLRDGGKPWNLVSIGSVGRGFGGFSATPTAAISHEDYALLYRMIHDYNNTVTMRVAIRGTISAGPETASITVAQIKGTETPDEQVIIGGTSTRGSSARAPSTTAPVRCRCSRRRAFSRRSAGSPSGR